MRRALHRVLVANPKVTDANKSLLVETLRSIAEILIWGDQNDNRVFEYVTARSLAPSSRARATQLSGTTPRAVSSSRRTCSGFS